MGDTALLRLMKGYLKNGKAKGGIVADAAAGEMFVLVK
jgi:hypothetical protein